MADRTFEKRSWMPVSARELYLWHTRPGAFERLAPPWQDVRVLAEEGDFAHRRLTLQVRQGPVTARWVAQHRDHVEGEQFVDEQVSGPLPAWEHTHRFEADGQASWLVDRVRYRPPLGGLVKLDLERMFRFRHQRTLQDLKRHAGTDRRLRVALTGASGLVGSALAHFLATGGHEVTRLVRGSATGPGLVRWNPQEGEALPDGLACDAVVHLAGESIAAGRWTAARKAAIRASRVDATRRLAQALARLPEPPRTLVVASAIGYYGDRGDQVLHEKSGPGSGFLPEVCLAWEAAADPAREAGIRVVHVRIGVVMSGAGGALPRLLAPFQAGVGGPVGPGRQHVSWIALDDLVGLLHFALLHDDLQGAVNGTAPEPLTSAEQARVLGRVLGRPAVLPAPGFALKALMGEMAQDLLLSSARVEPRAALDAGFRFLFPDLEAALRFELGR